MEALGVSLGFLLFQIFNFTIVAVLLYAWAYKPILKALESRKNKIAQGLEDARIAAEARANEEQEAAKIISETQGKSSQMVREATERAELATLAVRSAPEA